MGALQGAAVGFGIAPQNPPKFTTTTTPVSSMETSLFLSPLRRKLTTRSCTISAKYVRPDYLVKKVSAKEVYELVQSKRTVPLVIDFYATWCGPCILMAQELEMLAVEYEKNVTIVKVDTDDEYDFAHDMQCFSLSIVGSGVANAAVCEPKS
ncbi:thioredoxin-like protein CITRX2, chloroplastic isoform X2 [Amborella trichopoda]|uniref:thioredoxin-like protein CITRX2, chloroplastic isoform X2 n=1 Tax=Amborella trichopoda TaxID=13333 RepID=UPI0005D3EF94|nr:thioredoxin-like protein CITRX2, chloroplastic isoform X2 [Amborella trichopoda]|eukprot:XP_011626488.1 thioredoxin-like protein CITRX2, chloroplastic isoform X2 [Amborella trichopoda]